MPPRRTKNPALPPGTRVRLKPLLVSENFPDGAPEEFGEVISDEVVNDTIIVQLDAQYIDLDDGDDGLREVPLDQVERLS